MRDEPDKFLKDGVTPSCLQRLVWRYHAWRFKILSKRVALMEDICRKHNVNLTDRPQLAAHINSARTQSEWHRSRSLNKQIW